MVACKKLPVYVGVDPGQSGGVCWITEENVVDYMVMPPTEFDLWSLLTKTPQIKFASGAFIEKVHSMPNEGHKGAFTFGEGFGRLKMAFSAARIPYELVQPQAWQKEFGIVGRKRGEPKNQLKERCRQKAAELFPHLPVWTKPRTLGLQRAICDAVLIAEYARRCRTGSLRRGK